MEILKILYDFIVNDWIIIVWLWILSTIIYFIIDMRIEYPSWKDKVSDWLFRHRKKFGINLFYSMFDLLIDILWMVFYPCIMFIKIIEKEFDLWYWIKWLFKKRD